MWLKKRSKTGDDAEVFEIRCQPVANNHVANFSYPRTDFVHLYRKDQPNTRDSRGSESSPPPMVEDHGSEVSTEDDCHYRIYEAGSWDSWHAREHEEAPLIGSSAPAGRDSPQQDLAPTRDHAPAMGYPSTSRSQAGPTSRRVVVSCPEQRPNPPKPPPRACYSLFPPPDVCQKRTPAPLQIRTGTRQPGLEPSPLPLQFPSTPVAYNATSSGKGSTTVARPGSSRTGTPRSAHGSSFLTASSSDSIPLLLRSPGTTPPHSPAYTMSSSVVPLHYQSPEHCLDPKQCSPSSPRPRNDSLSKTTTRSTPSLATLAKAQVQDAQKRPPIPTGLHDRPLPPLPTERPPSPPHISVFEADSDDEDGEKDKSSGSDNKSFARRFIQGLAHHHHERKDKGPAQDHKRSVSDEGPSSRARGGGGRNGISRTLNAASRYRRRGEAAAFEGPARTAMSMDLPRRGTSTDRDRDQQAATADEGERTRWFRSGRGAGGEFSFAKMLKKRRE